MAKVLARILTPLAGGTKIQVKNSAGLVQRIKELKAQEGEMICFDFVSLFNKVPIQQAMQAIHSHLTQDKSLEDRTAMLDICA